MPMTASRPDTAVLLVNLGTPDAPTASAVRRYLTEFLSDPRVVSLPKLLWQPLLRGVILPLRSVRLAARSAYARSGAGGAGAIAAVARDLRNALRHARAALRARRPARRRRAP